MAELALGHVGAAATAGAGALTTGSGFVGRHESSHREEMMETRRSMANFKQNLDSGDVTQETHTEFLSTRDEPIQRQNEYYGRIESYKEASWVNPLNKLKRKTVRKASNHSLRSLNESIYSGSDTSSISAESRSPPGSNLADDDHWRNTVDEATGTDIEDVAADEGRETSESMDEAEDVAADKDWDATDLAEEKDWREYRLGGVSIGDVLNDRYEVVTKAARISDGRCITWLALDRLKVHQLVRLQIFKSAPWYTKSAIQEINLLKGLLTSSDPNILNLHPGEAHIIRFDPFLHQGPSRTHVCMAFDFFEDIRHLRKLHDGNKGVPITLVKQIAKQVLLGLDYMHHRHGRGVIHTDIKPENLLIDVSNHPETITVQIAEWQNASRAPYTIETGQYRCPEAIIGSSVGTGADIWSTACVLFELITSEDLFDLSSAPGGNANHLAQMIQLLGEFPKHMLKSGSWGRSHSDSRGKFWNIDILSPSPLPSVLHYKHHFTQYEANAIANFLLPMLELDPAARVTAEELLLHPWLSDVPESALENPVPKSGGGNDSEPTTS
ncbi:kinase-like domain-containing protein [Mycena epipterygia]|nr:kinase-like domain-containing protein [Mycena epipterygia]